MTEKDQFAEYLSEGHTFLQICDLMELCLFEGQEIMQKIKKDLGWQAQ
jgi:hypothetical protein